MIETKIHVGKKGHEQPNPGAVFSKGDLLAFTGGPKGKVPVFSYDFLRDYRDKAPVFDGFIVRELLASMWEQKELDLGEFDTVSIPQAKVMDSKGFFQFEVGKGFPAASQRYLNWMHTKVRIEGDRANDAWQAHAYCHRPVLLEYELKRDLRASEAARLKDAWTSNKATGELGLSIEVDVEPGGAIDRPETAHTFLPFPFLDERCGKKGKHLVMLYVTTPHRRRLKVRLVPAGVAKVPPYMGLNLPGSVSIEVSTIDSLVTYRTDDQKGGVLSGLFEGSPLVSIESLSALETRQKQLEEDSQKYEIVTARDQGKFVLSFIPEFGTMLSAGWELSLRLVDYEASGKRKAEPVWRGKALELGAAILTEILEKVLKAKGAKLWDKIKDPTKYLSGDAKAAGSYLDRLDNDLKALEDRIKAHTSPFKRSAEFQKDPRVRDQLVLVRLRKREWGLKAGKDGFEVRAVAEEEVAEAFFVRPVDLSTTTKAPFHYCFGPRGGLLERDDAGADSSIDKWERHFFDALRDYKGAVPEEQSVDEYVRWLSDTQHLAGTPFSAPVKEYLAENGSKLVGFVGKHGGLPKEGPVTGAARANLLAYSAVKHLWDYLNVTIIQCPACGHEMQLNWGWCPYHGRLEGMSGLSGSKGWWDEFVAEMGNENSPWAVNDKATGEVKAASKATILQYLKEASFKDATRLLVHCSQFIVIK